MVRLVEEAKERFCLLVLILAHNLSRYSSLNRITSPLCLPTFFQTMEDFKILKVLGKGSFSKVRGL